LGTIDDDAKAFEAQMLREGALGEFDVTGLCVIDAPGASDFRRLRQAVFQPTRHQGFDFGLAFVGKFQSVGAEQLDAVVVVDCAKPKSSRRDRP